MTGHHPQPHDDIDRHHASVTVTCAIHGTHYVHLDSEDDFAWLLADNLKTWFTKQHLTSSIATWATIDAADETNVETDDDFSIALAAWPL